MRFDKSEGDTHIRIDVFPIQEYGCSIRSFAHPLVLRFAKGIVIDNAYAANDFFAKHFDNFALCIWPVRARADQYGYAIGGYGQFFEQPRESVVCWGTGTGAVGCCDDHAV